MALTNPTKVYNYARMTTATTGTGTITLGSAVPPYLTFAQAGVSDGDVLYYSIVDGTSNVECGIGTYTAAGTTLSRTTVLRSSGASNTGKISLSGSAEVHIEFLADGITGNQAWADAAATKSDQQTGTSVITAVTPGHQQDHDSSVKAWVSFTGSSGAILSSYNISGITRSSAGNFSFTVGPVGFATANYVIQVTGGGAGFLGLVNGTPTATTFVLQFINSITGTPTDPAIGMVSCYGRQ